MKTMENTVTVWDPLVRLGHWTLVVAFFTAYIVEDDPLLVHVWAGYVVGAVVGIRLIWGFVGSKHARFVDFVRSPTTALRYLRGLLGKKPRRYIGHNPAGGLMVVVLLLSLLGTVHSGLMLSAIEENAGPFSGWVAEYSAPPSQIFLGAYAYADENEHESGDEDSEEFWEEIHEFFANFTLFLVVLHVVGVLASSIVHKENLIKAMINGRKRRDAGNCEST